ncbi:MAG: Wzz/FepE/Etk N-terminal domain-containing protein [Bacteroidota bacterium]
MIDSQQHIPENQSQIPIRNTFGGTDNEKSFSDSLTDLIIKLKPYFKLLWQNRWRFILFNLLVLILTILYLLLIAKPYFKSTVTILPDYGNKSSEMLGQLSGLASLAGVSVGDTPPTQIYQNLITSESVLSEVIYNKYQTKEFKQPVNLIEYFEIEPDETLPKDVQKRKMFLKLYEGFSKTRLTTDLERMTKILTVTVEMPESKLSAEVANKIVESLDNYVRTQRKSFATEQRKYLEQRVEQVKDTLTFFEERLKDFRSQNRMILQSPELQLEQARLVRNVEIQQTVYGELLKQLELVKLQEVKDTPVVNIKELAKEPVIKAGPKRAISLIITLFLSVLLSGFYFMMKKKLNQFFGVIKS